MSKPFKIWNMSSCSTQFQVLTFLEIHELCNFGILLAVVALFSFYSDLYHLLRSFVFVYVFCCILFLTSFSGLCFLTSLHRVLLSKILQCPLVELLGVLMEV